MAEGVESDSPIRVGVTALSPLSLYLGLPVDVQVEL